MNIRLVDFCQSMRNLDMMKPNQFKSMINKGKYKIFGTPGFIPPEAINSGEYSNKSDIFSVGATLFTLATRKLLWPT